jgi:hypothetical protein
MNTNWCGCFIIDAITSIIIIIMKGNANISINHQWMYREKWTGTNYVVRPLPGGSLPTTVAHHR